MNNILGHTNDLKLYAACGNVRYQYINTGDFIDETYFDNQGEITKRTTKKLQ